MDPLTDDELDHFIGLRLRHMGIDLSVLPEEDSEAPADRRRVMTAIRRLLRYQMPAVADLSLDPIAVPPILYPSRLPVGGDDIDRTGGEA